MIVFRAERTLLAAIGLVLVVAAGCTKQNQSSLNKRFTAPSLVAMAVGNPQIPAPVVSAPTGYKDLAYYTLTIQGIPMGSAVFATKKKDNQNEFYSEIKVGHRLGYAPLVTGIRFSALDSGQGPHSIKQTISVNHHDSVVFESESEWTRAEGESLKLVRGQPESHLLRLGLNLAQSKAKTPELSKLANIQIPLVNAGIKEGAEQLLFNPLTGSLYSSNELSVSYGKDGFAEQLKLPWFSNLSLDFKRESEDEVQRVAAAMPQNMLELAWFSTPATVQDDLKALKAVAVSGMQFARSSEKLVRKEFPQLPYLFHRKLFNFNTLCERIVSELHAAQDRRFQPEQALIQMGWTIRNILAEDHRELPRSLVNSPELETLADDSKKWQWPRIISHMLVQTNEELKQVLEIEDSQKVNVAVRMNSRNLARGSVVKGMLRSGALHVHHQVESAGNQQLSTSSLVSLPMNFLKPVKIALNQSAQANAGLKAPSPEAVIPVFEFINGQAFAKGDFQTLSPVCDTYQGRIGLDLGESKNELFSSSIVRGVWDESTRVQLIRQFARRASAHSSCRDIVLRAPGDLTAAAKSELESFRKDILQTEMEFQISVGSKRSLRLVPGSYELVISSLVNGSILGKREIIIPQGHQNLVLNLQL